jgi:arsenite transporter
VSNPAFSIASTQVSLVVESIDLLGRLLMVYLIFLVVAALIARILSQAFRLPVTQGRVLAFSFGTRNSFVVSRLSQFDDKSAAGNFFELHERFKV